MKRASWRSVLPVALILALGPISARAEPHPGDSCVPPYKEGDYIQSGGPEEGGAVFRMTCQSGVWVAQADGLPLCAVGDMLRRGAAGWECCTLQAGTGQSFAAVTAPAALADGFVMATSADGARWAVAVPDDTIYISADEGQSWAPAESARAWSGIAMSADGQRIAATVNGGQIYVSADGGVSWTARAVNRSWGGVGLLPGSGGGIAMSADGQRIAAIEPGGRIYVSVDGGTNWTARAANRSWGGVAVSADGQRMAAAEYGGQVYVSTDGGVNWTAMGPVGDWVSLFSSADGLTLAAAQFDGSSYTTQISHDGGANWTLANILVTAMAGDGLKMAGLAIDTSGVSFAAQLSYDGGYSWWSAIGGTTGIFPMVYYPSGEGLVVADLLSGMGMGLIRPGAGFAICQ